MTSQSSVYVLGGYQTDFGAKYTKAQLSSLVGETVNSTLAAADISASQVEVIHISNALGGLFINQTHLGAMVATAVPELSGVPSTRHEAACASGSVAVMAAMADLESGRYDVALVVGAEIMRDKTAIVGADPMTAADWEPHETERHPYVWANKFSKIAKEYKDRYGLNYEDLRSIAIRNYDNAGANPNAQTRKWDTPPAFFSDDETSNPKIAGLLRRSDCSQITDGGAGIVIVSERWLRKNGVSVHGPLAKIAGWGHTTTSIPLQENLDASLDAEYMFPHLRKAITDAFDRAEIDSVWGLDGIEVHDCFSITQLLAMDHLGITKPGCIGDGLAITARDGILPINPSGGLIGAGHPLGATGIRMILDASLQVTNQANTYQIPGARRFATLNVGGTLSTNVITILETVEVS